MQDCLLIYCKNKKLREKDSLDLHEKQLQIDPYHIYKSNVNISLKHL